MKTTLGIVLGGGQGSRLRPLTQYRSKPAVPLAGKYRLIDIPLSNCLNSGIDRIYVLTQFLSVSLHQHLRGTYHFDQFGGGFVEALAAQQTIEEGTDWYQGTADAVRKNLRYLKQPWIEHVLILSGDQLYRMDFAKMLAQHRENDADVSIAALPVPSEMASSLGIMRCDMSGRVAGFLEKPTSAAELDLVRTDADWLEARGIASEGRDCLASMGIYLFNRDTLIDCLEKTEYEDFGREVFPAAIRSRNVYSFLFDGYWEDIGTIRSFYEANLSMTRPDAPFLLSDASAPIYTRARFLPPTRLDGADVTQSLIADGCVIEPGASIENSVIGLRCRIGANCQIRNSILMGADYYETSDELSADESCHRPPVGIGANTVIDTAIVDKNARIGRNVSVKVPPQTVSKDCGPTCVVRDGIAVVEKDATLPDGWSLE